MSDLTLFIPAEDAARCAEEACGGFFYSRGRATCPGCGSSGWVPVDRDKVLPYPKAGQVEEAEAGGGEAVAGSGA